MSWTMKQIFESISEIEKDFDLLNKKINGVFFWKIMRFKIFRELSYSLGEMGTAHPDTDSVNGISKIKKILKSEIYTLNYNALNRCKESKVLLFMSPRKLDIVNGEARDMYISPIEDSFKKIDYLDYEKCELQYNESISKSNLKLAKNLTLISKLKRTIRSEKKSECDLDYINNLEESFKKKYGMDIELKYRIYDEISNFKIRYAYYKRLLKKTKSKFIFFENSYGYEPLIAAAKDMNVISIEMQHGTITKYHPGFSFNGHNEIPYFPSKMFLFGKYWAETTPLPLTENNTIEFGFPYYNDKVDKLFINNIRDKKTVIVLSQGTASNELINIMHKVIHLKEDYKFIYKLHPSEYKSWKTLDGYSRLRELSKEENVEIIDNNEISLYDLMLKCEYQIGLNSTAIFEGISLGLKTIVIDGFGIEYMEDMISKNLAVCAKNSEDIIDSLEHHIFDKLAEGYIFSKVSNQDKIIKDILMLI